jgi:hypothetical protein
LTQPKKAGAVAHGVGQDVAQRGRDQVVERDRALRQGQVDQLLTQGVGERLPDRARRQRGEVVGDAVHQRMGGAAERLQLAFAGRASGRFAHIASIDSVPPVAAAADALGSELTATTPKERVASKVARSQVRGAARIARSDAGAQPGGRAP